MGMEERTPTYNNQASKSKQEVILFRLDGIEKQLDDMKKLLVQTSLQEEKIQELQKKIEKYEEERATLIALKADVEALKNAKKKNDDKWWQIALMLISPFVSALLIWIIGGGLK